MGFINLYVQTEYSILNSTIHISRLCERVQFEKVKYCAICDDAMYGTVKFYKAMTSIGVKPIIGLSLTYDCYDNYEDKVLLYAKDNNGYKNLMYLSSLRQTRKLTLDDIKKNCVGLLCVVSGNESLFYKLHKQGKKDEFMRQLEIFKSTFESLYFGLSVCGADDSFSKYIYKNIINFDINVVAIHKTNYLSDDEFEAYKILKSVANNNTLYHEKDSDHFLGYPTLIEVNNAKNRYPIAFDNIEKICDMCDVDIEFGTFHLPLFKEDKEFDSKKYLMDLCMFGLKKRSQLIKDFNLDKYLNRLNYELDIIDKMGFNDYFLIVYDFVRYAKNNDIIVGVGRGSGPNSLVSYCLGISEVNPIEYDLLFERFLSLERKTMPDIDIDFTDERRSEVIKYVGQKYGANKVCHITALGTYGPKGAIKDVCRIKKIEPLFEKELLKYINSLGSFENCNENEMFIRFINQNSNIKEIVKICKIMESLPRNVSTHAAGIIISDKPLTNYTPLTIGLNGLYQSQFDKDDLESLGLVKMDFLSLRNLSTINDIIKDVYDDTNTLIDINRINFNDQEVFKLISSGDTYGLFQLESSGMRSVLKRLKPTSIIDIAHVNALYRPGPMEMIDTFIKRKNKLEEVKYPHESVKDVLKSTYGIIVFQEQIMQLARSFAGYSLGEADILRRAVSKKKREILENERIKFVSRAKMLNRSEQLSNQIYDYIVKFADYGFNKAHAVSYSIIGYQMAYLKTHYFKYFMANLINQTYHDINMLEVYISECNKKHVEVVNPDINYSSFKSMIVGDKIYLPLSVVNQLGGVIISKILEEREKSYFKTFEESVCRIAPLCNKQQFLNLINAGCFDNFGLTKKAMVESIDNILLRSNYILLGTKLKGLDYTKEEYSFDEVSGFERDSIGFNLKYDPFLKYRQVKEKYKAIDLKDIEKLQVNKPYIFVLRINKIREITTKTAKLMAFLDLSESKSHIDGVIFPEYYQKLRTVLIEGKVSLIKANIQKKDDKYQLIIENAYILD